MGSPCQSRQDFRILGISPVCLGYLESSFVFLITLCSRLGGVVVICPPDCQNALWSAVDLFHYPEALSKHGGVSSFLSLNLAPCGAPAQTKTELVRLHARDRWRVSAS